MAKRLSVEFIHPDQITIKRHRSYDGPATLRDRAKEQKELRFWSLWRWTERCMCLQLTGESDAIHDPCLAEELKRPNPAMRR